jgi:ribonuclease R
MTGQRTRLTYSLGQAVEVQLVSATPRTGGMVFRLMQGDGRGGRGRKLPPSPGRRSGPSRRR